MTPMRRAIAMLVQYPVLGQLLPVHEQLSKLAMPGIDLLLQLHRYTHKQQVSTAQLLEAWRGETHEKALRQLASWEHNMNPDNIDKEFADIYLYLIDRLLEQRYNQLLEKQQSQPLTKAEMTELNTLLKVLKSAGNKVSAPS